MDASKPSATPKTKPGKGAIHVLVIGIHPGKKMGKPAGKKTA